MTDALWRSGLGRGEEMNCVAVFSVLLAAFGKAPEVKERNRLAIGGRLAYLSETDGNQGNKA
ncbi:MAG: hypothetical protein ACYS8I_01235 [Planctomycetota bacterium]